MEPTSPHSEASKVADILKQPFKSRSQREVDSVVSYLSRCFYFRCKAKEMSPDFPPLCARIMTYELLPAGQVVYREGDSGGKLYVLLSGSVAVASRVIPLLPTEAFGEDVLECGDKRQHTVTALETSEVAVLHKTDYLDLVDKLTQKTHLELINFLHTLPSFARISRGALQRIVAAFETRTLVWKQVLCRAGDPVEEVCIVKQGEFTLLQSISAGKARSFRGGKYLRQRANVALIGPGEFVGEADLMGGHRFSQTCVCHSLEGQVLVLQVQVCCI